MGAAALGLFLSTLVPSAGAARLGEEIFPMFRGNPARTGYVSKGPEPPLELLWKFKTRRGVNEIESLPAADGFLLWRLESGLKMFRQISYGGVRASPVVRDVIVFIGG